MLYELTFAQLLTLVEVRNARELKAYERAEANSKAGVAWPQPPKKDLLDEKNLPNLSTIRQVFAGF